MAHQENIPTLLYSPSLSVYAGHRLRGGKFEYYDLSDDVTNCNVSRNENSCSTFSLTLMNHRGKYNGLFEPMDIITIYAQKEGRVTRLFTGYMNDVTKFSLFPDDFTISGNCSLYRLQRLWWDPHLNSSYDALVDFQGSIGRMESASYEQLLLGLLTKVGGLTPDDVRIGAMPEEVVSWAQQMWEAQQSDADQLVGQMDEFYDILMTTGMTGGSGGGTTPGGDGPGSGPEAQVWDGTVDVKSFDDLPPEALKEIKKASKQRQKLVEAAITCIGTPYEWGGNVPGVGIDCSGTTKYCYSQIGLNIPRSSEDQRAGAKSTCQPSECEVGDIWWCSGHVGLYIGGGWTIEAYQGGEGNTASNRGGPAGTRHKAWATLGLKYL